MIIEAILIVLGGLTSAGHCLGMCGGFVLTLGANSSNLTANLRRQLVYATGRVSVYTLAGAMVGYTGWRVAGLQSVVNFQAWLSIVAGILLIGQGLATAGLFSAFKSTTATCPGASTFAALLRAKSLSTVFVAGACNGLLPCALVYAYLALAAASGNMLHAALVMALFGTGTVLPLTLAGLTGNLVTVQWRQNILRVAAGCILLTGSLTLVRGVELVNNGGDAAATRCPFCSER